MKLFLKDANIFLKNNYKAIISITFITLLLYGIKLFNFGLSIDNEQCISNAESIYGSWISIGRLGLVATKEIFGLYQYNPYFASILILILLPISCICFTFSFSVLTKHKIKPKFYVIFSLLYISSPILAEQLGFVMQASEVLLGIIISSLCAIWIIEYKKNYHIHMIIPILLLSFSFLIYQALIPLYSTIAASLFFICCLNKNYSKKQLSRMVIDIVASFIAAVVIYIAAKNISFYILGIDNSAYTDNQILWKNCSFKDCIKAITQSVFDELTCARIFYSITIPASIIIFILIIIYCIKNKFCFWIHISSIFLLLTPFLMNIILGGPCTTRVMLPTVYICPFFIMLGSYLLSEKFNRRFLTHGLSFLVVFILIFNQFIATTRLYYTEYITNIEQKNIAYNIAAKVEGITGKYHNIPVVFIGSLQLNRNKSCFNTNELELVGRSYFEVTFSTSHGTHIKDVYLQTLGYGYIVPSEETIQKAESYAKVMPVWPAEGSIAKTDECVIVKLS